MIKSFSTIYTKKNFQTSYSAAQKASSRKSNIEWTLTSLQSVKITEKWELLRGVNCWKKKIITKSQWELRIEKFQIFSKKLKELKIPKISDELTIGVLKRFKILGKECWFMIICLTAGVDLSDETRDSRRNFDNVRKCRKEYKLICLPICTSLLMHQFGTLTILL